MNDAEALRLLHSMVRIRSFSGEEDLLARFLAEVLRQHAFDSQVDEVGNVVATIGSGPRTLALVGHIDTVPGEIPVLLQDGVLHGRGAVDAKGPMASFIAAAARYAHRRDSKLRLLVIGCVGEEAPNSEGARYVLERHSADFLVIGEPSGWDGITLGYKGSLRAEISFESECGHGAHQRLGAAEAACALWERVREDAAVFSAGRPKLYDHLLTRLNDVRSSSDGLTEFARVDLSLRLPPDLGPDAAGAWLRERATNARTLRILGALPAWSGPRTTPLHRELARAITSHGGRPNYKVKTGTADLNLLAPAWGCPALAYGPGDASLDHTPQERLQVDEYLRSVSILTDVLTGVGQLTLQSEPVR